ncbi:hypothetical protein [Arthrobacter sp.]|uniref:hypothetical protein n=1 Tax=Arthrobacter sp. TaxID=1667 RepID=UPI003A8EE290
MTAHDGGTGLRLPGLPAGSITLRDARTATTREVELPMDGSRCADWAREPLGAV